MAARARPSSQAALAAALVAIAMTVASCSSHDTQPESDPATTTTTSRPEPPADPRLREVAGHVGCSATAPVDRRDGAPGAVLCKVGGRTVTRIQRFEPSEREEVERRFSGSFGDAPDGGVECDGETYRFVVLGDDWLVATDDPAVAGRLVVHHGAAFVGPSDDPESADVCP